MLEHAIYSVISPEGCAAILWEDASRAKDAAEVLRVTAPDLLKLGVIDGIIPEPPGAPTGTGRPPRGRSRAGRRGVRRALQLSPDELIQQRYAKFRRMGIFEETLASSAALAVHLAAHCDPHRRRTCAADRHHLRRRCRTTSIDVADVGRPHEGAAKASELGLYDRGWPSSPTPSPGTSAAPGRRASSSHCRSARRTRRRPWLVSFADKTETHGVQLLRHRGVSISCDSTAVSSSPRPKMKRGYLLRDLDLDTKSPGGRRPERTRATRRRSTGRWRSWPRASRSGSITLRRARGSLSTSRA